ncbi:hypothetical protein KSF_087100 [Reticulibacter mediterranei]|uniref:Uncharacterized protein n=1 Tax=Reticulibacter mediterranei TaxID=2778369 RepID=A0A8J3N4W5_9CHLR|nr:hypothetical protein [Reticulibacter mediterranei]GHO98662.1 hypothetical protein KSF_087100 [Reticulibacter mediterranei]
MTSFSDFHKRALLQTSLSAAVPLRVLDYYEQGGPTAADVEAARVYGRDALAPHGDLLLFRSRKEGETAALFNGLAKALAVLAFLPGGVPPLLGASEGFDAQKILAGFFGQEEASQYCQGVLQRALAEDVPVWAACYLLGQEADPHAFAITTNLLATLSLQDLRDLRIQRYTNRGIGEDGRPRVSVERVTSRLLMQVASSDLHIAALVQQAVSRGEALPVCRLDGLQTEAWIRVHRPDLAGEGASHETI